MSKAFALLWQKWQSKIPDSLLGKKISLLILAVFFIFPFQTPIFHKLFRKLSYKIIPADLILPPDFFKRITLFLSEIFLVALLLIILRTQRSWAKCFFSGSCKYLTLFFIVVLFSIGASSTSHYLLTYYRFFEFASGLILFCAISAVFNAHTIRPLIRAIAWLILIISLFECAVGLIQYFSQAYLGLKYIGENHILGQFSMPNAKRWVFDTLFNIQIGADDLRRASGTFPHPNNFGGFQFFAILNTCYLYFTQSVKKHKMLFLCALVVQMITLTVIFSRAAIFGLILSLCIWFVLLARDASKRKAIGQLSLTFILSSILCVFLFYEPLKTRGGLFNYTKVTQISDGERMTYNAVAVDIIKERPFLGIGHNNYQFELARLCSLGYTNKVHNIYLLIAAESGLIGLGCFLLFLFSLLFKALKSLHVPETLFLLSLFIGFLFIGNCDYYLLCTPHGQIPFFGTAALLYICCREKVKSESAIPARNFS